MVQVVADNYAELKMDKVMEVDGEVATAPGDCIQFSTADSREFAEKLKAEPKEKRAEILLTVPTRVDAEKVRGIIL